MEGGRPWAAAEAEHLGRGQSRWALLTYPPVSSHGAQSVAK